MEELGDVNAKFGEEAIEDVEWTKWKYWVAYWDEAIESICGRYRLAGRQESDKKRY